MLNLDKQLQAQWEIVSDHLRSKQSSDGWILGVVVHDCIAECCVLSVESAVHEDHEKRDNGSQEKHADDIADQEWDELAHRLQEVLQADILLCKD